MVGKLGLGRKVGVRICLKHSPKHSFVCAKESIVRAWNWQKFRMAGIQRERVQCYKMKLKSKDGIEKNIASPVKEVPPPFYPRKIRSHWKASCFSKKKKKSLATVWPTDCRKLGCRRPVKRLCKKMMAWARIVVEGTERSRWSLENFRKSNKLIGREEEVEGR